MMKQRRDTEIEFPANVLQLLKGPGFFKTTVFSPVWADISAATGGQQHYMAAMAVRVMHRWARSTRTGTFLTELLSVLAHKESRDPLSYMISVCLIWRMDGWPSLDHCFRRVAVYGSLYSAYGVGKSLEFKLPYPYSAICIMICIIQEDCYLSGLVKCVTI